MATATPLGASPAALPPGSLARLTRFADVGLAFGVVGVVVVLVVPIPTHLLDILLCCQLALSLAILLGTLYAGEPLEFSGFPSMLLFVTLFRLGLNVASSRLILLQGDAGRVIQAFGDFVVGGNYVVGATIFLILVAIQFVVITKGAGRVAEVAARFTLDAMPGKQMAIDADLNQGLIDEGEARERREKIQREASFFGAMDGASKFVRGDAVAGVLITVINILGGLGIGVLQRDMELAEAMRRFTLLSIGDGLVTQLPALLVSTASGIIVTRGATANNLGEELTRQLLMKPRPILICAGFLLLFSIVPGLPTIPFLAIAGVLFLLARVIGAAGIPEGPAVPGAAGRLGGEGRFREGRAGGKGGPGGGEGERLERMMKVEVLELELGAGLIYLADQKGGGDLLNRIAQVREKMAAELGVVVPPVRVRDNLQLAPRKYRLRIRGATAVEGELFPQQLLSINPGQARSGLAGTPTHDPAFGLPALWIKPEQRGRAEAFGYTVVEAPAVLSTHFHEALRSNAAELLSRQDVQNMVERLKETDPAVIKDVIPNLLSLPVLHRVLQGLLRERIPIRDMVTILETLGDSAGKQEPCEVLVEKVRAALAPMFVRFFEDPPGTLHALALDPELESKLIKSVVKTDQGPNLILTPLQVPRLLKAIEEKWGELTRQHRFGALICSGGLRPFLRRLISRSLPKVPVLSYLEIPRGSQLKILSQIPAAVLGSEEGGLFGNG